MFWRKREEEAQHTESAAPEPAAPVAPEGESRPEGTPASAEAPQPAPDGLDAAQPAPDGFDAAQLEGRVIEAISTVFDPEIPVNIYELGLIYDIEIDAMADVRIRMTLTSPACPVAGSLPGDVQRAVETVDGVRAVDVDLVWEPPWTPDRMSEAAKLELGFM